MENKKKKWTIPDIQYHNFMVSHGYGYNPETDTYLKLTDRTKKCTNKK